MKALAGLLSLLLVLGVVALLAKKQTAAAPGATQPTQQLPQQVKQQVEAALQQTRAIADDK